MDANTNISLDVLHDAIVADIRAKFPSLVTVEFYREDRKSLPLPACLLTLTEFEASPDDDPGTEQLAVMANFEAELLIGFKTLKAKQSIRLLAAQLAAWLHNRRWDNPTGTTPKLPTGPCLVAGAYPDDFQPELDNYEIWRVEWQQIVHLGETVWTNEGVTPGTVFVRGHVSTIPDGDYEQVAP
jgi:hypothetical protein